ncbi:unnamed protein product [Leuciscus chuanchicus]
MPIKTSREHSLANKTQRFTVQVCVGQEFPEGSGSAWGRRSSWRGPRGARGVPGGIWVRVGQEEFPEGSGSNKRAAREAVALKALEELRSRGPLPERVRERLTPQKQLGGQPTLQDCLSRQCLSGLRCYAAAHGEELVLDLVEQTGPPNSQRYTHTHSLTQPQP